MSIRDEIRARGHKLKFEVVDVTEWDRKLVVQELNVRDRNDYVSGHFERVEVAGGYDMVPVTDPLRQIKLVILTTREPVEENGKITAGDKVFTDEDLDWLAEDAPGAVDRLYEVAAKLSGLTTDNESGNSPAVDAGKDSKPTDESSSSSS